MEDDKIINMIQQPIVDYVSQSRNSGMSDEQITEALKSAGWQESDISDSFNNQAGGSSIPPSDPVGPKHVFNKKLLLLVLVGILVIGGSALGYFYYNKNKPVAVVSSVSPSPTLTETPIPTVSVTTSVTPTPKTTSKSTNPDISRVTAIMVDICQGYLTSNNSLIIKHASAQTVTFLTGAQMTPATSCSVNKVYQSGTNIIANITLVPTTLQDMVFIKEGGDWKFDLTASMQFAKDKITAQVGTGDPNGYVDLVVTKIVPSSNHPIVNDKNFNVVVTIKNIGTKTSSGGAPFSADLLGFYGETPFSGGQLAPLAVGNSVTWAWYPYKYNDSFGVGDTAGQKTVKIEANFARQIIESNYDNNVLTQTVQVYSN